MEIKYCGKRIYIFELSPHYHLILSVENHEYNDPLQGSFRKRMKIFNIIHIDITQTAFIKTTKKK